MIYIFFLHLFMKLYYCLSCQYMRRKNLLIWLEKLILKGLMQMRFFRIMYMNITEKTVKQEAAVEAVADTKVQAEKTGEVSKETVKGQYSIILASRVSKKGAEDFVKRLNRAGYKEASVYEEGSMRRVVYGSYGSEREAERALNVLKKKNETFAGTWVQKL